MTGALPVAVAVTRARQLEGATAQAPRLRPDHAELDKDAGTLRYVNAGHCPPNLLGKARSFLLEPTGVPVALVPGLPRGAEETTLEPGSLLLVFSDGISETEREGVQYEEGPMAAFFEHLRTECTQLDAACAGRLLLEDVAAYRGESPADDDLTLLVLRRER